MLLTFPFVPVSHFDVTPVNPNPASWRPPFGFMKSCDKGRFRILELPTDLVRVIVDDYARG